MCHNSRELNDALARLDRAVLVRDNAASFEAAIAADITVAELEALRDRIIGQTHFGVRHAPAAQ